MRAENSNFREMPVSRVYPKCPVGYLKIAISMPETGKELAQMLRRLLLLYLRTRRKKEPSGDTAAYLYLMARLEEAVCGHCRAP